MDAAREYLQRLSALLPKPEVAGVLQQAMDEHTLWSMQTVEHHSALRSEAFRLEEPRVHVAEGRSQSEKAANHVTPLPRPSGERGHGDPEPVLGREEEQVSAEVLGSEQLQDDNALVDTENSSSLSQNPQRRATQGDSLNVNSVSVKTGV